MMPSMHQSLFWPGTLPDNALPLQSRKILPWSSAGPGTWQCRARMALSHLLYAGLIIPAVASESTSEENKTRQTTGLIIMFTMIGTFVILVAALCVCDRVFTFSSGDEEEGDEETGDAVAGDPEEGRS
eukprot:TRINITY_DN46437_c0_g1_i1.p1 TRINITY_DN46437_c0_g1~~TRINITY_DN46437_c0_g1_i1.p1  ORF type:complete len:128 (+),score=22.81 TRINITY_DN46437_c0_g1_i1:74-457(+)